jgi:hypothetical protein
MKICSTNVIYEICSHERDLYYDRRPDAHRSYIRTCTYLKLVCILHSLSFKLMLVVCELVAGCND